jgi:hypothetical protein
VPWPVYSERFLHHQAEGWWVFRVPENTRCVVTNFDVVPTGGAGYVALTVGPILCEFVRFQAESVALHATMKVVAYQGEEVALTISATGLHSSLSGTLFEDNSNRTGPPIEQRYFRLGERALPLPAAAA